MSIALGLGNGVTYGGSTFSPLSVPDLFIWHDSRQGVQLSGSNVTQWNDLSGNGYHAVDDNNAATPPTYVSSHANFNGLPAIDMTGGLNNRLEYLSIDSGDPSDWTFIFVIDAVATFANQYLFDTQSGRMVMAQEDNTGATGYFDGAAFQVQAASATGPQILVFRLESPTGQVYRDGTLLGSDTYTQRSIDNATGLGGRPLGLGGSIGFGGYMGAVMVYKRAITDTEMDNIIGYYNYV